MILEIRLREEAERELSDAIFWYEKQKHGLGREFSTEIRSLLLVLAEMPLMYPIVHKNIHRALLRRFPFGIHYIIEASVVEIIAVMHCRRDSRNWAGRK